MIAHYALALVLGSSVLTTACAHPYHHGHHPSAYMVDRPSPVIYPSYHYVPSRPIYYEPSRPSHHEHYNEHHRDSGRNKHHHEHSHR
jgi:hypothetical protein